MAYSAAHNLLTVFGRNTSAGSEDMWQFGLRIGGGAGAAGAVDQAQVDAYMADVKSDLTSWFQGSIAQYFSNTCVLEGAKIAAIGTDGKYIGDSTTVLCGAGGAGIYGTSADPTLPAQVAIAVTLRTNKSRGLASKGRIYLPAPAVTYVAVGGVMQETFRDNLENATATLLTNLNNWPGIDAAADPGNVRVFSKVGAGTSELVTGVSIGNRFDVQRRRANRIPEIRNATLAAVTS